MKITGSHAQDRPLGLLVAESNRGWAFGIIPAHTSSGTELSSRGWSRVIPLLGLTVAFAFVGTWAAVTKSRGESSELPIMLGLLAASALAWGFYRATTYETVGIDPASNTITWRTHSWSGSSKEASTLSEASIVRCQIPCGGFGSDTASGNNRHGLALVAGSSCLLLALSSRSQEIDSCQGSLPVELLALLRPGVWEMHVSRMP